MKDSEKNHIDDWLKKQIKKGVDIIQSCGTEWCIYYTGHLHKDILNNFPGKTSKKVFKSYRDLLDSGKYVFTQKKFETNGYEYMVRRTT